VPIINKTKYAILGILTLMPCSGYDIKKFCDKGISCFWNENIGHIYPVLKQMENEELVTKRTEQSEGNPPKNVYTITQKGKEELEKWMKLPIEHSPERLELLLKMFFAKSVSVQYIIKELENEKNRCLKTLEESLKAEEELSNNERARNDLGYPYWLATIKYGIENSRFKIKWCDETLANISNYKKGE